MRPEHEGAIIEFESPAVDTETGTLMTGCGASRYSNEWQGGVWYCPQSGKRSRLEAAFSPAQFTTSVCDVNHSFCC
jgi:hypothetical protein